MDLGWENVWINPYCPWKWKWIYTVHFKKHMCFLCTRGFFSPYFSEKCFFCASFVLQNLVRLWNEFQENELVTRQVTFGDHVPFEVQIFGCMNAWLCCIGQSSVSEKNDNTPDSVNAERHWLGLAWLGLAIFGQFVVNCTDNIEQHPKAYLLDLKTWTLLFITRHYSSSLPPEQPVITCTLHYRTHPKDRGR